MFKPNELNKLLEEKNISNSIESQKFLRQIIKEYMILNKNYYTFNSNFECIVIKNIPEEMNKIALELRKLGWWIHINGYDPDGNFTISWSDKKPTYHLNLFYRILKFIKFPIFEPIWLKPIDE